MDFYFLDTSAVIKAYIQEVGSGYVKELLSNSSNVLFVTVIVGAEGIAGLNKRHRIGDISTNDWNVARSDFLRDYRYRFKKTRISKSVIDKAISLLDQHPLRGYDSVQLTSALLIHDLLQRRRKVSLTFVCADTLLCNIASSEGLNIENPLSHP